MTTREKLDAVYALDAKRTPGDWELSIDHALNYTRFYIRAGLREQTGVMAGRFETGATHGESNAKLLAEAPTMVSLLRELEARIKVLGEALGHYAMQPDFMRQGTLINDTGRANRALAAAGLDKEWEG